MDRHIEGIELTADCMEDDVAQALFGEYDEHDFEEILDDFCVTASEEPLNVPGEEVSELEFDWDKHFANLLEKNESSGVKLEGHEWWNRTEGLFSKVRPLDCRDRDQDDWESDEEGSDEEEVQGIVPNFHPEEEQVLCDAFESTLAEYDSDLTDNDVEELASTRFGNLELEEPRLESDVTTLHRLVQDCPKKKSTPLWRNDEHGSDRFTQTHEEDSFPLWRNDEHGIDRLTNQTEEDSFDGDVETSLPLPSIGIDSKPYLTPYKDSEWDCESILSTYSNLSHNPTIISRCSSNSKIKMGDTRPSQRHSPTPSCTTDTDSYPGEDFLENDTNIRVNKGEARQRGESKEDKRQRKLLVKLERKEARADKQQFRVAFQEEVRNRLCPILEDGSGNGVYKY